MASVTYEASAGRVRLVTDALSAGKTGWQITRHDSATGRTTLVRGGRNIARPVGSTAQLFDYEWPADSTVRYYAAEVAGATVGTPAAMAAAATYALDSVWLRHPTRPYLSRRVHVVDYEPPAYALRPGLVALRGRQLPVARGDVAEGRSWRMTVRTATVDDRDRLDRLLRAGGVLFVHVPAGTPGLPRIPYNALTEAQQNRAGRTLGEVRRTVLTLSEAAAPSPDFAGSDVTYAAAEAAFPTYAAAFAAAPTYADAEALQLQPGEVLIP